MLKDRLKVIDTWSLVTLAIIGIRILYLIISNPNFSYERDKLSNLTGCNTASIIAIFLISLDVMYRQSQNKKPRYYIFLIAVVIALLCGGNGNILSLSLLLLGMLLVKNKGKSVSWSKILLLIVFVMAFIVYEGSDGFISFITDDHYRFSIWSEYFLTVRKSVKNIVFGAKISNNAMLMAYGHMHNSFINLHFFYGLIPTITFMVFIIKSVIYQIRNRQFFYITLLLVTIIRSFTDEATLILMPIWIYFECERRFSGVVLFRAQRDVKRPFQSIYKQSKYKVEKIKLYE